MSYFDLDDILAGQQRIQCVFEVDVAKLGFLNSGSRLDKIGKGTRLELPNWLAISLYQSRRPVVSIEAPKAYGAAYRTILDADARVVDLNKLGPHFYSFGIELLRYDSPEFAGLGATLLSTFTTRFRWLMDKGSDINGEERPRLMDKWELKIYEIAQRAIQNFHLWINRETDVLTATDIVNRHKRRRLV